MTHRLVILDLTLVMVMLLFQGPVGKRTGGRGHQVEQRKAQHLFQGETVVFIMYNFMGIRLNKRKAQHLFQGETVSVPCYIYDFMGIRLNREMLNIYFKVRLSVFFVMCDFMGIRLNREKPNIYFKVRLTMVLVMYDFGHIG